jgi:hypothetical protein
MSFPVTLTSANYINNNTYRVNLSSTYDLSNYSVAVGQCFLYYSWFNINSVPLNNNKFTLSIPRNGGTDTLNITIPDGSYNIEDLNNFLEYTLYNAGYYITETASGLITYYASFNLSPTDYKIQFNTINLPISLPAGFTSGGMTFPASANQNYQLTVLSTNDFKDIIGFYAGTYPPAPTNVGNYTKSSDYTPNVSPVSSVQMRLSCVYNPLSFNSQLLHIFTNRDSAIGEIIDASPNYEQFVPCIGSHKELTLQFYDQNGNVLNLLDPNVTIKLIFKKNSVT